MTLDGSVVLQQIVYIYIMTLDGSVVLQLVVYIYIYIMTMAGTVVLQQVEYKLYNDTGWFRGTTASSV